MRCTSCYNPVKPDITFYGEDLPYKFFQSLNEINENVDLCLIMGTALSVSPFNTLPFECRQDVPKVLFNMNNTDETGG